MPTATGMTKMNKRLHDLAIKAGYVAPELAGRLNTFATLLLNDCINELATLHFSQAINNQNHPAAWHDGVDACIASLKEAYTSKDV